MSAQHPIRSRADIVVEVLRWVLFVPVSFAACYFLGKWTAMHAGDYDPWNILGATIGRDTLPELFGSVLIGIGTPLFGAIIAPSKNKTVPATIIATLVCALAALALVAWIQASHPWYIALSVITFTCAIATAIVIAYSPSET